MCLTSCNLNELDWFCLWNIYRNCPLRAKTLSGPYLLTSKQLWSHSEHNEVNQGEMSNHRRQVRVHRERHWAVMNDLPGTFIKELDTIKDLDCNWHHLGCCIIKKRHLNICFKCHEVYNIAYDWLVAVQGARFTNNFLLAIQIRWKLRHAVIPLLTNRSQQIFAHATTAQLSCHVQNLVVITVLESRWEWNEISIGFELRWKKR